MLSQSAIRIALKLVIVPVVLFCLCSTAGAATPMKRVRLLFADLSERMGIGFVAKDQRFFEENGLEVDLVQ
ncbi:MAG: hypothetical protein ACREP5_11975, partial [Candidatus Binatia bacterium]